MIAPLLAEFFGTAFLLAIVVGSGIMGESLSSGNAAIVLLATSLATGAGLFVLIQSLGPISGAHFNPAVSLVEFLDHRISIKKLLAYVLSQLMGAGMGVICAHAMFEQALLQNSAKIREGSNLGFSEFIATFGLISVIRLAQSKSAESISLTVAAYITSAYWFTSSTSFANPAVTLARTLTNSFCGIASAGVPVFIFAQLLGTLCAWFLLKNIRK